MRCGPVNRPLVTSIFALAMTFASAGAYAQSPKGDDAEAHFKRGVALYQENDFRSAVVEFRRAYEIAKSWKLLYNVAQAEYQNHDYVAALASFERYLAEGAAEIPKTRRAEVEREIAKLAARVGKIRVTANVEGATVTIDGERAGAPPVTKIVAIGEHRVEVSKEGHATATKSFTLAGGDAVSFDAALTPHAATPPPRDPVVPPPPRDPVVPPPPPAERQVPWALWAVTGVLAAGAVTTGVVALGAASDLDAAKGRFDVGDDELDRASTKAKTFAIVTDVLLLATVVTGGISLYLSIDGARTPKVTGARRDGPVHVDVGFGLGGLAARGRF